MTANISTPSRPVRYRVAEASRFYVLDQQRDSRIVATCDSHADAANVCSALNAHEQAASAALEAGTGRWFDASGNLQRELPADCIRDCSGQGPVDAAVASWVDQLAFTVPREIAIRWLAQGGGWPKDELEASDDRELAERCLWILCCDAKESGDQPYGLVS